MTHTCDNKKREKKKPKQLIQQKISKNGFTVHHGRENNHKILAAPHAPKALLRQGTISAQLRAAVLLGAFSSFVLARKVPTKKHRGHFRSRSTSRCVASPRCVRNPTDRPTDQSIGTPTNPSPQSESVTNQSIDQNQSPTNCISHSESITDQPISQSESITTIFPTRVSYNFLRFYAKPTNTTLTETRHASPRLLPGSTLRKSGFTATCYTVFPYPSCHSLYPYKNKMSAFKRKAPCHRPPPRPPARLPPVLLLCLPLPCLLYTSPSPRD